MSDVYFALVPEAGPTFSTYHNDDGAPIFAMRNALPRSYSLDRRETDYALPGEAVRKVAFGEKIGATSRQKIRLFGV